MKTKVREMMTVLGMDEYDDADLDEAAGAIAQHLNFKMAPFSVQIWRLTGKRVRKVEYSVSYRHHPLLGENTAFHTRKIVAKIEG